MPATQTDSIFGGKMQLGPVNVYANAVLPSSEFTQPAIPELFLGANASVDISMNITKTPLMSAQGGTKPLDQVVTGVEATAVVSLLETTLEVMNTMLQGFELLPLTVSAQVHNVGFVFTRNIGQQDSDIATTWRFTRVVAGIESDNPLDSIFFLVAAPTGAVKYTYDASKQRNAQFTLYAYPDDAVLYGPPGQQKPVMLFGGNILSSGLVTLT